MILRLAKLSIWWFALGYFLCYIPYSILVKALSSGYISWVKTPLSGNHLLPWSLIVSAVGMFLFLALTGLWRYATSFSIGRWSFPRPSLGPFLSGICTSVIIVTTTLAYTFNGVSIVFAMLLMRGGVLLIAPMIDALSGRKVRWYSWIGMFLSLLALVVAFAETGSTRISNTALIDITIYIAAYFVRLRLMSYFAKSEDDHAQMRYFAEEQIVAAPLSVLFVIGFAVLGNGSFSQELVAGFSPSFLGSAFWLVVLIGLFSQGTGIFGGLILLGKQENTYCVPVNRSSSILAGVFASFFLTLAFQAPIPSAYKLAGAFLIITAILFLSLPPLLAKKLRPSTT